MSAEALGNSFDVCFGAAPVDLSTAGATGKRVSLKNCSGVTILLFKAIGTAGDDPTVTLQQHTASSSGTTASLAIIDHYYLKTATTPGLLGTETWSKVTQSAAATIADPGGAGTSAESQQILAIEVRTDQLTDGYSYVSLNVADVGSNAQLGGVLYVRHNLAVKRGPANLPASLA